MLNDDLLNDMNADGFNDGDTFKLNSAFEFDVEDAARDDKGQFCHDPLFEFDAPQYFDFTDLKLALDSHRPNHHPPVNAPTNVHHDRYFLIFTIISHSCMTPAPLHPPATTIGSRKFI